MDTGYGLHEEQIDRFSGDLPALDPSDRIGIAVSGGPDSLALLLLATAAMPDRVEAATIDHGLRPESVQEAAHVATICATLGIVHEAIAVEVTDRNVQSGARRVRYAALASWSVRRGLGAIATAHHIEDQAETLLMRLNRGSGLSGLAGIRADRMLADGEKRLIRPLLGWHKAELIAICAASPFAPIDDLSNRNVAFDRVVMRRNLAATPWLDLTAVATSAAHLAAAEDYLKCTLDAAWSDRVTLCKGGARYASSASRFENIEMVFRLLECLGATSRKSDVATLVSRLESGRRASLGGYLATADDENGLWRFEPEPERATR